MPDNYEVIIARLDNLKGDIDEIKRDLKDGYVTRYEFSPVRAIVYGLVGLISTGVVVALLSYVLGAHAR